jgi:Fe2+ or Zn2+ uptake regulation protein
MAGLDVTPQRLNMSSSVAAQERPFLSAASKYERLCRVLPQGRMSIYTIAFQQGRRM